MTLVRIYKFRYFFALQQSLRLRRLWKSIWGQAKQSVTKHLAAF
jgi:hypothetical protein